MQSANKDLLFQGVSHAIQECLNKKIPVMLHQRIIDDLGIDSLRIVRLAVLLENQFEIPLVLSDWMESVEDFSLLTVASLVNYLDEVLAKIKTSEDSYAKYSE